MPEERLAKLETDMAIASANIAAVRSALLGLSFELCACRPDIPERLARAMMDSDAAAIRAQGGIDAELAAVETEVLAEAVQGMAR